jgi:hypothetical protein
MMGITSNGITHSSLMPYFSRSLGFFLRSCFCGWGGEVGGGGGGGVVDMCGVSQGGIDVWCVVCGV